jgi:hypothetical protein
VGNDIQRAKLYSGGLLNYPLFELIPRLMKELADVGLVGGKDGSQVDMPSEPGTVAVDAGGGQLVWIRPGASAGGGSGEVRSHRSGYLGCSGGDGGWRAGAK